MRRIVLIAVVALAVVGLAGYFGSQGSSSSRDCLETGWTSYGPLSPKPGDDPCMALGTYEARRRTRSRGIDGEREVTISVSRSLRSSGVSLPGWKSVIRDSYDGRIDHAYPCAAVRKALDEIPHDTSYYGTPGSVSGVLLAYAKTVC